MVLGSGKVRALPIIPGTVACPLIKPVRRVRTKYGLLNWYSRLAHSRHFYNDFIDYCEESTNYLVSKMNSKGKIILLKSKRSLISRNLQIVESNLCQAHSIQGKDIQKLTKFPWFIIFILVRTEESVVQGYLDKGSLHPAYTTSDHCSEITRIDANWYYKLKGVKSLVSSSDECARSFPWMTDLLNRSVKTAVFKVNDYSLDSRKFCNQLENMSIANGVEFHYKTRVSEIIVEGRDRKLLAFWLVDCLIAHERPLLIRA